MRAKINREDFDNQLARVSAIDWARLAAFIDSEGTVYINRVSKPSGKGAKSPAHNLAVAIPNASPVLMSWITSTFGGGTITVKESVGWGNGDCFEWRMNAWRAARILTHCEPYMLIKREQAVIGVAMQFTKEWGSNTVSSETIALRDASARMIKELNASVLPFSAHKNGIASGVENIEAKFVSASPIDLARLAAYVDAEGTICINRTRPSGAHATPMFRLSVAVVNTNAVLLNWLQDTFGGNVYAHGKNPIKPCWMWCLSGRQAAVALQYCLPYFLIKHVQAETGIAFRKLIESQRTSKVSDVELQAREELRNKIHALNSPFAEDVSAQGDSCAPLVQ